MEISTLEYWTNFSFNKMKKDGATMPTTISKVLEIEEFKNSGLSEDELRQSIKEKFAAKRATIIENLTERLKEKSNEQGNANKSGDAMPPLK